MGALEIARHSHRTITWGFKINDALKKLDPEPEAPAGAPPGGVPGPPGGMTGATTTPGMPGGAPVY